MGICSSKSISVSSRLTLTIGVRGGYLGVWCVFHDFIFRLPFPYCICHFGTILGLGFDVLRPTLGRQDILSGSESRRFFDISRPYLRMKQVALLDCCGFHFTLLCVFPPESHVSRKGILAYHARRSIPASLGIQTP
jgi:hypothetical protein